MTEGPAVFDLWRGSSLCPWLLRNNAGSLGMGSTWTYPALFTRAYVHLRTFSMNGTQFRPRNPCTHCVQSSALVQNKDTSQHPAPGAGVIAGTSNSPPESRCWLAAWASCSLPPPGHLSTRATWHHFLKFCSGGLATSSHLDHGGVKNNFCPPPRLGFGGAPEETPEA